MERVIEVIVTPKGEITVQTRGYAGTTCRGASRFLQDALGITTAEHRTAEFHQDRAVGQSQDQAL